MRRWRSDRTISGILAAGQHGTTAAGGNPLKLVLRCWQSFLIESDDLPAHVRQIGTLMSTALRKVIRALQVRGTRCSLASVRFGHRRRSLSRLPAMLWVHRQRC